MPSGGSRARRRRAEAQGPVEGAGNLLELLGFLKGRRGLIEFLQKLCNRKIQRIEKIDQNRVRIHIERSETIDIDPRILELYKSTRVRDALSRIIAEPLNRIGVDEFRTKSEGGKDGASIKKTEANYFEIPPLEDEVLGENLAQAHLQIVNLAFKEDNKWRFSRGDTVFHAYVDDSDFLAKIARNEGQFAKDDILKVELYARDVLKDKGISTEYRVRKVLEHRSAARQLQLPSVSPDEDGGNPKHNAA